MSRSGCNSSGQYAIYTQDWRFSQDKKHADVVYSSVSGIDNQMFNFFGYRRKTRWTCVHIACMKKIYSSVFGNLGADSVIC